MALSWTSIGSTTKISKQIITEIFTNLQKVEASVGITDYQSVGSSTAATGLITSKDLIDIYRRLNEAYYLKHKSFPTLNSTPANQGQLSVATIQEIRSILDSFGV